MKKYFVTLAVTVGVCTQVALANNRIVSAHQQQACFDPLPATAKNDKINSRMLGAFEKNFTGATSIKWEKLKCSSIAQVHFNYNKERFIVFFDNEGKLVATSRFISEASVPLLVKQNIERKYAAYNLLQIVELTQNDETSYVATFDNDRIRFDVQLFNDGGAYVIKKEKKNLVAGL